MIELIFTALIISSLGLSFKAGSFPTAWVFGLEFVHELTYGYCVYFCLGKVFFSVGILAEDTEREKE